MDDVLQQVITPDARRHVHLLGICGCGMSGLAQLLVQAGHQVSGSDIADGAEMARLRAAGIDARRGHPQWMDARPDLSIFSSAITDSNPELVALRRAGVPTVRRGEFLAAMMNARRGIAVAGTHGKTTTSAMIADILTHAGLAPSYCVGGEVPTLGGKSARGAGDWFVAEADESDGTLVCYSPHVGVILNIEEEHLDYYSDLDAIVSVFRKFATNTPGRVYYCADDPGAVRVCADLPNHVSFGLNHEAEFGAAEVKLFGDRSSFVVARRGRLLGSISLRIPGVHNVSNALAATAVALDVGVPLERIAEALAGFSGARRRFDRKFDSGGILVVDDYGHHPTEVRATIAAARLLGSRRVLVAFQPHRYTRTKWLRYQFASAFVMADKLFLTELYAASEAPIEGVSGRTIYDAVRATGQSNVEFEPSLDGLVERLATEAREGDLILVMGAGSITSVAERLAHLLAARPVDVSVTVGLPCPAPGVSRPATDVADELRRLLSPQSVVNANEPMALHTTLRVGGKADLWVEPAGESDLAEVLKFCRERGIAVTAVGRGSNLLVRDGGIRGVVLHLAHSDFAQIEVSGTRIVAGAGVALRRIVHAARDAGLSGLEFLEGIPGSLGGALRMNAGAMERSLFDVVESVRTMDMRGGVLEQRRDAIEVRYRQCVSLAGNNGDMKIALSAALRGQPADATQIERKLLEFAEKRRHSQPAAPSAGCIFKNPLPELPAGRLIDQMGCKGMHIGGAQVSQKHANFIVTESGAKARDVLELIRSIQQKAEQARGIRLETEVQVLGEDV